MRGRGSGLGSLMSREKNDSDDHRRGMFYIECSFGWGSSFHDKNSECQKGKELLTTGACEQESSRVAATQDHSA